jgi:hypothetical protein
MRPWIVILVAGFLSTGCTHLSLENNTVKQSATWTDVQYQQILNNLAMFCKNPSALPYFSVAGSGVTQVSDQANANGGFLFHPFLGGDLQGSLGGTAGRQISEQWSLATTTDPDKLDVIRCLYQFAMGSISCDDCVKTINDFYGYPPDPQKPSEIKWERIKKVQPGWFHFGCKKDVPKNACYVGQYCDTYVWVMPEGYEGLTQFTLAVLDVATADPAPKTREYFCFDYNAKNNISNIQRFTKRNENPFPEIDAVLAETNDWLKKYNEKFMKKSYSELNDKEKKAVDDSLKDLRRAIEPRVKKLDLCDPKVTEIQQMLQEGLRNRQEVVILSERLVAHRQAAAEAVPPTGRTNFYSPLQGLQFVPRR